jgi:hypothetical protein
MNMTNAWFTLALLIILGMTSAASGQQQSTISDDEAVSRIAWWRDAKFGLFMHWGVYSILGRGEWVQWDEQVPVNEYAKLAGQFHPDKFDPDAWAAIAKSAGMKYTVLTSRHHDGFALFDELGSNFTAMKSAANRDFVAEYVNSIRKAGLHVGLYYSPLDWRFPGFFFPDLYQANAVEILGRTNVGRSAFYAHFREKDELLASGIHNISRLRPQRIRRGTIVTLKDRHRRAGELKLEPRG